MVRRLDLNRATKYREKIEHRETIRETPIGVVVPFDFELDWEYWRYLPESVSLYFTRTPYLRKPVGVSLAKEVGKPTVVAKATRALTSLNPAVTLYACSSGSFIRGAAGERHLRHVMIDAGAKIAVTTSGAMVEALRGAGAQRIALATPYTRTLTLALVDFLEEAGFDVVSAHYLGMSAGIVSVSKRTIANLVRDASRPEADAIFVSCTALGTYGILASLEQEVRHPVFTSNQVSLWAALKEANALNIKRSQDGRPWVLGGGRPMARSTRILLDAAKRERTRGVA